MKTQKNQTNYKTALYMRLSREDEGNTESSSIGTQRKLLRNFAHEHDFFIHDEYIDDGYSGTNFDRPAFKQMITDIERGYINLIITKDLSRLGRDYIQTGEYTERFFPEHEVRYISINDGYDSISDLSDIVPFKNVLNELYARDTSKKIRSAFKAKMEAGDYIGGFAPYGYKKSDENKNKLVVDYEVAHVVKKIFELAENGERPKEIAEWLNNQHLPTPAMHKCLKHNLNIDNYSKRKEWTSAIVCKLLKNTIYLGHTAQGKTTKVSFKSKIQLSNANEDWIIVENTHEALISEHTFDMVRRRSVSRKNEPKSTFKNIFSGIAKCSDCGRNMSSTGTRKKGAIYNLVCGGYKLYGTSECSNHFIDYETLYNLILSDIRKHLNLSGEERQKILKSLISDTQEVGNDTKLQQIKIKKRIIELDRIIQKLYEDNVVGKITNERFEKILTSYEVEQSGLKEQLKNLIETSDISNKEKDMIEKFFKLLNDVTDLKELTPQILHYLIDCIEIEQGYYEQSSNGKIKKQAVHVYYKFVGKLD